MFDVAKNIKNDGLKKGLKQFGHIALTDFPTKDGIPIPGLSGSTQLGNLLKNCGINPKWMCLNVMDTSVGVLCVADGYFDIVNAFSGNLQMNFGTFCSTFGQGSLEIGGAILTKNPLLLVSGTEHIVAGIVSAWKTYTIHIDFGATLTSTLLGFLTSKFILKNDMQESVLKAAKSGLITGLFQLSASFGYGAAAGVAYMEYVKYLAKRDSEAVAKYMRVDKDCYERFIDVLNKIEDKEVRDAYIEYDNDIADDIVSSQYSLISEDDMDLALSAMNKQEHKLEPNELKKLTQGDFLVNYLERE